jgi:hypothetical protein
MSTENSVLRLPFEAVEDLSLYQYHFVALNSSRQIKLLDTANEIPVGILQDAPTAGQAGNVMLIGQSKVVANAALVVPTWIMPEFVSVTDCGKAKDAGTNWAAARGFIVEAAAAEDDLASVFLTGPYPPGIGRVSEQPVRNGLTSAVAGGATLTLTAAQLMGGYIRATPTEAQAMTLPTQDLIYAAMPQPQIGSRIEFAIANLSAYTITVGAGSGGTLTGTATIATVTTKRFLLEITALTPTYTCWSLGPATH